MDANTLEHASKHHSSSSGHSTLLSSVHHSTRFTFAASTPVNTLNFGTDTPLFKEPPMPPNPAPVLKPPSSRVVENVSFADAAKSLLRVNIPTQKPATQESAAQKSPTPKPATPKPPPSPKSQRTARKLQGYHPVQLLNHLPELSYGHLKMNLVSIYARNTLHERKLFFQNLHEFFFTGSELIIGGDFNCVDSNQDKYGGNVDTGFVGRQELAKLKSDFYLTDIWQKKNPRLLQFTWTNVGATIACRLDKFLISKNLMESTRTC